LNKYLAFDGYQILIKGKKCRTANLVDSIVQVKNEYQLTDDFVHEQFSKLDEKLRTEDFDGAITNSRSIIEGVVAEIHHKLTGKSLEKSGLETGFQSYPWIDDSFARRARSCPAFS
jgi:hypothetical protein